MNNLIYFARTADEDLAKKSYNVLSESAIRNNKYQNPYNKPIIETALQDFVLNRNNRIYVERDMLEVINSSMIQEKLLSGNLKGEDEHPVHTTSDPKVIQSRITTVLGTQVCHKILKLWIENHMLMGHVIPSGLLGKAMEEDIREGAIPAFSFRGLGKFDPATKIVKISVPITWDKVAFPSHKNARMTGIVQESMDMGNNIIDTGVDTLISLGESVDASKYITNMDPDLKSIIESYELDIVHDNTKVYKNGLVSINDNKGNEIKKIVESKLFQEITNIQL